MSGWRVLLQEIAEAGDWVPIGALKGGPLSLSVIPKALKYMRGLGFVERRIVAARSQWRITQRGQDLLDGRLVMRVKPFKGACRAVGAVNIPVATWLSSLPRAGEIRL